MGTRNLIEDLYHDVLHAPSIEVFKGELVKFADKQGFDLVAADHCSPPPNSRWTSINNYPREWLDIRSNLKTETPFEFNDPNVIAPSMWSIENYKNAGAHRHVEILPKFGFHAGIDVPITVSNGAKLFIDVASSKELTSNVPEIIRVIGEIQLFGSFAWHALARLISSSVESNRPKLTPKEFEVIKWTVAGKTAYEVGQILSCSERTANFHLQNIFRKLNVVNKQAAIARVLEWKLIV